MPNQRLFKFINIFSYVFLLINALAVPLFLDKNLINFYIIPKQYVFMAVVLVNLLLFAAKIVLSKKLSYRHSILDWPILVLLGVSLISSVFSINLYDSFFGRTEFFVLNFIFLAFLALFYFLIVNVADTPARWRGVVDALIISGGLAALLFILKTVFNFDLLAKLSVSVWNTVDQINSPFGLLMVVVFMLAAGQLLKKSLSVGRSLAYFFVVILSFTCLTLLSFKLLWWILLAGLVLLLLLGVSFVLEARMGWISTLFAALILVAVFIVFGTPKSLQSAVPVEIALGVKPSWSIASSVILSGAKNFLIGSGLGTFGVDFSKFRTADFNTDQFAWSLRFNQPFSSALSLLSEGGLAMFLVFIFLCLFLLGHALNSWFRLRLSGTVENIINELGLSQSGVRLDVFLVVVAWIILTAGLFATLYGPVLWWLWWLMLGLTVTGLSFFSQKIITHKEWEVEDTPQYSLSFSFVLIVVMAGVIMAGVWGVQQYLAETTYAQALRATDLKVAESKLSESLAKRQSSDLYHAALAQVFLLEAIDASRKEKPDVTTVSNLVAEAVNEAKVATDLSPQSVALWENLSTMYENAAALVPDARGWAIKSLTQASGLEPSNPVLFWRLGNNYGLAGNWMEAIKSYQKAIELKKDYVGAYLGLASAFEQTKELDKAVEVYKTVLPAGIKNPEFLFNFGRLLYNRNGKSDRDDAEKLWQEAARLQPNYSNALYSLGLLYEARGDKATALKYYYKVKDLNPENKDVAAKIANLVGAAPKE